MDQPVASKRERKPLLHTFITSNPFTQESHNGGIRIPLLHTLYASEF